MMNGRMSFRLSMVVVFIGLLLLGPDSSQAQVTVGLERPTLSLEELYASPRFFGRFFQGGRWAEAGPIVTYIEPQVNGQTDLISFNLETDERTILIAGRRLQAPDVNRMIRIEDYQFSHDGTVALLYTDSERVWRLNTKGYYYLYNLETGSLTPISDRAQGFQMFAKLSPDGTQVAFVRDRNLFRVELATMTEVQLTEDGSEGKIINGTSDWVYEEEFGLRDGWAWSPDSRYIAFYQFDESNTRDFIMTDLRGHYPEPIQFRYPKAGEVNSEIRIGVLDVKQGSKKYFPTNTWNAGGDEHEYLPQMQWTPEINGVHHVMMFRINRDQNDLDVLYGSPESGGISIVLEEHSDTWLDVETGFNDLDVGQITYLADGEHFVWISDESGYRHLYLYKNTGERLRQITQGAWDVTDFHGIANGNAYFTGTIDGSTERHLYRWPIQQTRQPHPIRITEQAGWHDINMSADKSFYIDSYSNATTPSVVTLHRADGQQRKMLESNDELIRLLQTYSTLR